VTRILVDLLFFTGKKGGMESYVRELYGHISPVATGYEFVGLASQELAASDTSWFPGTVIDSGISGENRVAWARGEILAVSRYARRIRADLVHAPANLGPVWTRVPLVLTLHDLLPFRHPEYVPGAYARVLRTMIRLTARRARRIVTVSEESKADITRYLRVPRTVIDVVPLAGRVGNSPPSSSSRLPRQLLAVGNRMPHKNFLTLLEALALIPAAQRPHLVITGSHGDDPLAPLVARLGIGDWVSLRGWLSAEELERLYAESTMVVLTTLFEGFGLPALEAMSRGCPVVCSDIPVLHEVAGTAARYVDPTDARSLAANLLELLDAPHLLRTMSQQGRERSSLFSWQRTAQQTMESFQRALEDR
jgi:glycosyltransferase involved in cell wall biosynthesis